MRYPQKSIICILTDENIYITFYLKYCWFVKISWSYIFNVEYSLEHEDYIWFDDNPGNHAKISNFRYTTASIILPTFYNAYYNARMMCMQMLCCFSNIYSCNMMIVRVTLILKAFSYSSMYKIFVVLFVALNCFESWY